MKRNYIILFLSMLFQGAGWAQNVGIGTETPLKLLSVNGSIMIDQSNMNSATVDSAALRFGSATLVGISSNKNIAQPNVNGLDLWTNGTRRISILSNGRVGINTSIPEYTLDVGGTTRVSFLYSNGISSTGSIFTDFDLNADDDLYVGDDATIMGNVGIGAGFNTSYKLLVSGNGLFTTNVGIDGTLRVDGKLTNEGKGIVLSNSSTTLRSGFTKGSFSYTMGAGGRVDISFCIIPFTGTNDNVRVMVAQFIPGSGASSNAGDVNINVVGTTTSYGGGCNGYAATVRFSNTTSSTMDLGDGATLYLYTVVTD